MSAACGFPRPIAIWPELAEHEPAQSNAVPQGRGRSGCRRTSRCACPSRSASRRTTSSSCGRRALTPLRSDTCDTCMIARLHAEALEFVRRLFVICDCACATSGFCLIFQPTCCAAPHKPVPGSNCSDNMLLCYDRRCAMARASCLARWRWRTSLGESSVWLPSRRRWVLWFQRDYGHGITSNAVVRSNTCAS